MLPPPTPHRCGAACQRRLLSCFYLKTHSFSEYVRGAVVSLLFFEQTSIGFEACHQPTPAGAAAVAALVMQLQL
jgi:hypothetical protein